MHQKERNFLKFKGSRLQKSQLHNEYKRSRLIFDKQLRFYERIYKRKKVMEIDALDTTNPKEFWKELKKLGPRKCKNIPMYVYDENVILLIIDRMFYTNGMTNLADFIVLEVTLILVQTS
jgi:hypothetical protein